MAARDSDHALIARLAKRSEWVIPQRAFDNAPEVMQSIIDEPTSPQREKIQAARTLVMMANANTGAQSVEVRINQAIAIVEAPAVPENVNIDVQSSFIEEVNTASMQATVQELEALGLLGRYIDQVKTSAPPLPSNGDAELN